MVPQVEAQASCEDFCAGVVNPRSGRARLLAWLGVLLPCGIFWATCIRYLSPLPVADDYDVVLLFLVHMRQLPTFGARVAAVLFEQHNEYKLIWVNALAALQYSLAGHVSFVALSLLGDLHIMLLAWLLWKTFARTSIRGTCRLALFVPVALILFQTNYGETLDWSMAALQNIGVLTFALLSLWWIDRAEAGKFAGACVVLALAIAASGNGFFLVPVGLLMLLQQRRFTRMALWTLMSIACAAVYFAGYHRYTSTGGTAGHPGLHPIFLLSFVGAFAGVKLPLVRYLSVPIGACMLAGTAIAAKRGCFRRNPALTGFVLFLLITALGVSVTRGSFGYAQSLSGRYKIYSDLLLICLYAFGLDIMEKLHVRQRVRAYRWILAVACFLFLFGTAFGIRAMKSRYMDLNRGMALYRSSGGADGPMPLPADGTAEERDSAAAFNVHFRDALREAAVTDLYHLP